MRVFVDILISGLLPWRKSIIFMTSYKIQASSALHPPLSPLHRDFDTVRPLTGPLEVIRLYSIILE